MLENEYIVFTGTLITMTRKQAQSIIQGLNGNNQNSVTQKTTILVAGNSQIDLLKGYQPSKKLIEAENRIQSGQTLKIMSEKEFMELLDRYFKLISKSF